MEIGGRTALITGAASGIGRATAIALAEHGAARLALADVDVAGLEATAAEVRAAGARARVDRVDMADLAALQAWLAACEADSGYDVLHNNAGVVSGAPQFPDADPARLRWVIDVNLTAVVTATQAAVQAMARRGGGVIVNTVSTVALGRGFVDVMYAASKAGVMMFTTSCASLQASHGVRVVGVLPGLTQTPIFKATGNGVYAPWMEAIVANNLACSPEDIAAAVIDLVADEGVAGGDWVAVRNIDGAIVRQWGRDTPPP